MPARKRPLRVLPSAISPASARPPPEGPNLSHEPGDDGHPSPEHRDAGGGTENRPRRGDERRAEERRADGEEEDAGGGRRDQGARGDERGEAGQEEVRGEADPPGQRLAVSDLRLLLEVRLCRDP